MQVFYDKVSLFIHTKISLHDTTDDVINMPLSSKNHKPYILLHIRDYEQQHIRIWNPEIVSIFHIKVYRFAYFLRLFLLKVFWLSAIILIKKNTTKLFDHIIKKFIKFAIKARVNIFLHLKSLISKKLIKNRYFNEIKFWNLSICDVIMRSLKAFQNIFGYKI